MSRRPLRRRLLRVLLVLLVLGVLLRLLLPVTAPWILSRVLAGQGLAARYGTLDLSLLGGSLEIWGLEVRGLQDGTSWLRAQSVRADVDVSSLLVGDVVVRVLELDRLELRGERDAAGRLTLLGFPLEPATGESAPVEPEPAEEDDAARAADAPPDLSAPLRVDALRLQDLRLVFDDALLERRLELNLNLQLSDLGADDRPTELTLTVTAPQALDVLTLEARAEASSRQLDLQLDLAASGLHPSWISPWLEPLGVRGVAGSVGFGLEGSLRLEAAGGDDAVITARATEGPSLPLPPDALALQAALGPLHVVVDGARELGLDGLSLDAAALAGSLVDVTRAELSGVTARGALTADSALRVAGFEFLPAAEAAEEEEPASASRTGPAPRLRLGDITLTGWEVLLRDEGLTPPVDLELRLEELALAGVDSDAAPGAPPATLAGRLAAPGVLGTLDIDGRLLLTGDAGDGFLALQADGLEPERLRPYLERAGITSELQDALLQARVDARWQQEGDTLALDATLGQVALTNRGASEESLAALGELAVRELRLAPEEPLSIGELALSGTRLPARRDGSGALHVAGLRFAATPDAATPDAAGATAARAGSDDQDRAPPPGPAGARSDEPALVVGRLAWKENAFSFRDDGVTPPAAVTIEELALDVETLQVGEGLPLYERLALRLAIPGVVGQLLLEGRCHGADEGALLEAKVDADGLSLEALRPYLVQAEMVPPEDPLTLDLALQLAQDASGISARVRDLTIVEGDEARLSLARLDLEGLQSGSQGTAIASLEVEGLHAAASLGADGRFSMLGMKQWSAPEYADAVQDAARAVDTHVQTLQEQPAAAMAPAARPAGDATGPTSTRLGHVGLSDVQLTLTDHAHDPPHTLVANLEAGTDDLVVGAAARPAPLRLRLAVPGALEALTLAGEVTLGETTSARLDLAGTGLRSGPLGPYLPPGLELMPEDGRLQARVELDLGPGPDGVGTALRARLADVDWREAGDEQPWLGLSELLVEAPQLAPQEGTVRVERVQLDALRADASVTPDGALQLLGLRLAAPPAASGAPSAPRRPSRPAMATIPDGRPAAPAPTLQDALARPELPLRHLELGALSLHVARLGYRDLRHPESTPLVVEDLRLTSAAPFAADVSALFSTADGDDDSDDTPNLQLDLSGRLTPVLDQLQARLSVWPLAAEPHAVLDLSLLGLRGAGLTEALPELAASIDGDGLEDGRLAARAELTVRGPPGQLLQGDVRNVPLDLDVRQVTFRDGPDGPVLAGFDRLDVDVTRLAGARDRTVLVESIELERPVARVRRDAEGLHLLGLTLLTPPVPEPLPPAAGSAKAAPARAAEGAAGAAASAGGDELADATGQDPAAPLDDAAEQLPQRYGQLALAEDPVLAPGQGQGTSVRVDHLWIGGVDIVYEDHLTHPPLLLPLTDLDLEVLGLSSDSARHNTPLSIELLLAAGEGRSDVPGPVFEEIAASARLQLSPRLDGWLRLDVTGMQLAEMAGPAAASGVTLKSGVMDSHVTARFDPKLGLQVDSRTTLTDLSLSESAGGPIGSFLALPAPLDVVVFILRDESGTIRLPVAFEVQPAGMTTTEITRVAASTLSGLIVDAVKASPFRVASTVGDMAGAVTGMVGLDLFGSGEVVAEQALSLAFETGSTNLTPGGRVTLSRLAERLAKEKELQVALRHELSRKDLELVAARTSPGPAAARALASRLRQRRDGLLRAREVLATAVRGAMAARNRALVNEQTRRLGEVDVALGRAERALDDVLSLLTPAGARRAERRTRQGALQLAQARLDAARAELLARAGPEIGKRIRLVRPRFEVVREGELGGALSATPGRTLAR